MHSPSKSSTRLAQLHALAQGSSDLEFFAYQFIKIDTAGNDVATKIPVFQFRLVVSKKRIQFFLSYQGQVIIGNSLIPTHQYSCNLMVAITDNALAGLEPGLIALLHHTTCLRCDMDFLYFSHSYLFPWLSFKKQRIGFSRE